MGDAITPQPRQAVGADDGKKAVALAVHGGASLSSRDTGPDPHFFYIIQSHESPDGGRACRFLLRRLGATHS